MWAVLLVPILLAFKAPVALAYIVIAYNLFWLMKSTRMSYALLRGFSRMKQAEQVDWSAKLDDLEDLNATALRLKQKLNTLKRNPASRRYRQALSELREIEALLPQQQVLLKPSQIYQVAMFALYNESIDVIRPSVEAVLTSDYDPKHVIVVIAYEARGGEVAQAVIDELTREYQDKFHHFMTVKHPDGLPGEVKGKGGNITWAGRELLKYVEVEQIPLIDVIITTLDSDNRPGKHYFSYLTYQYCIDPNRRHKSYQPIPMYLNNIWDVPAPTRVVATSNSFFMVMEANRPHRLRNFSSHAQSLQTLVDTDFWSVKTIVEDGHQFWRTYFVYDGDHSVSPLYVPIYQDAVLSNSFWKTMKGQFYQMRRWAYGVSDFPFIVQNFVKNKKIKPSEKIIETWRHFEGHFSWATAPLLLTVVAWLPLYLNHTFSNHVLAHELPVYVSWIETFATIGIFVMVWSSLRCLPKRPARYRRSKYIILLLQWFLAPVVAVIFGSFASINAQTRLLLGKRLDVFNVTEKVVKK